MKGDESKEPKAEKINVTFQKQDNMLDRHNGLTMAAFPCFLLPHGSYQKTYILIELHRSIKAHTQRETQTEEGER